MEETPIRGMETVRMSFELNEPVTPNDEEAENINDNIMKAIQQSLDGKWQEMEFYDGESSAGQHEGKIELRFRLIVDGSSVHQEEEWEDGELVCPEEYYEEWPDAPCMINEEQFISLLPFAISELDYYIDEPEILYPGL